MKLFKAFSFSFSPLVNSHEFASRMCRLRWEDSWSVARPFFDDVFMLMSSSDLVDVSIANDDDLMKHTQTALHETAAGVAFVRRHTASDLQLVSDRCKEYLVTQGECHAQPCRSCSYVRVLSHLSGAQVHLFHVPARISLQCGQTCLSDLPSHGQTSFSGSATSPRIR